MRDITAKIEQYADITDDKITYRVRAVVGGDVIERESHVIAVAQLRLEQALRDWRSSEQLKELEK